MEDVVSGFDLTRAAWAQWVFMREEAFTVFACGCVVGNKACHASTCGIRAAKLRKPWSTLFVVWLDEFTSTIVEVQEVIVRSANSKPKLSQLLFISVRQRELVKSSRWIGLSTYTSVTWSVHYFPTLPCDHVT